MQRKRRRWQARGAWGATAVFVAWAVLWQRPGEAVADIMVLMFMLAASGTLTLSGQLGRRDAKGPGRQWRLPGRPEEPGAQLAEKDPSIARAERIIEALHDMAESLEALSRAEGDGAKPRAAPPPSPVQGGPAGQGGPGSQGGPDRGEVSAPRSAARFSVIKGDK